MPERALRQLEQFIRQQSRRSVHRNRGHSWLWPRYLRNYVCGYLQITQVY